MIKRIGIGLAILVVLGAVLFSTLVWRPAIDPIISGSVAGFPAELLAKGHVLAGAGYCATCHTAKGGQPYAGGYGMPTPFGVIYTTNITPDPGSGIGRWSEAAFVRAMREGVSRDGSHLYPAFPFEHFTKVTDDDMKALYAFLMTREPVSAPAKPTTIPFPFNLRALQAGWKLLFFDEGTYRPVAGKSDEWNRGAYLAEGLSHCSACHTPRNALGAEKTGDERYAGAMIQGWFAPALTAANTAPIPWTQDELSAYLRGGATALHGVAAGKMAEVVRDLRTLPDSDIQALALYFAEINGSATQKASSNEALHKAQTAAALDTRQASDSGAGLYLTACGACHYNNATPQNLRPELALNSSLTAADPANFVQVVLHGVGLEDGIPNVLMPPFAPALSDGEIARLAAHLRRTRTDQPAWPDLEAKVAAIRKASTDNPERNP
ncbi:MAG: cytochrome c [Pseudomonas sp.]